jgi:hypothetical protein
MTLPPTFYPAVRFSEPSRRDVSGADVCAHAIHERVQYGANLNMGPFPPRA